METIKSIRFHVMLAGMVFLMPVVLLAENVGVFFNSAIPQTAFAAGDVQKALEAIGHATEMKGLTELAGYTGKKVVIAQVSDNAVVSAMTAAGGTAPSDLKAEGLSIHTTETGGRAWWSIGGDATGAMYGGLELAKKLQVHGLAGSWNYQQNAYIKNRGIKFNIAFDRRSPTYTSKGSEVMNAMIHSVWEFEFWEEYINEMARARFNLLSLWCNHPFTSMLEVPGYEGAALQDVKDYTNWGSESYKTMSIAEKNQHWKKVFTLAQDRGIKIYVMAWNLFVNGAEQIGISDDPYSAATKEYIRTSMYHFLVEFPNLHGFVLHAGEHFGSMGNKKDRAKFLWDSYGQGVNDYQQAHDPNKTRDFNFIYRLHEGFTTDIDPLFKQLAYNYDFSIKYSAAHMFGYPAPKNYENSLGEDLINQLTTLNRRFWLNVRNDDMYYLNWCNYHYAQSYILNFPAEPGDTDKDRYVPGFYMGSDGNTETRTFYSKDPDINGKLDLKKNWGKWYAFGYAGYDPHRTDEDFKEFVSIKMPDAPGIYDTWAVASRGVPMANSLVTGWNSWKWDYMWWPEGSWSSDAWRSLKDFQDQDPTTGSERPIILPAGSDWAPKGLCGFNDYENNRCGSRETPVEWGNRMKTYALHGLQGGGTSTDKVQQSTLDDIKALSYLGWFYSGKIRAAAHDLKGDRDEAIAAAGESYWAWKYYSDIMEKNYTGRKMLRTNDWTGDEPWASKLDDEVLDDYKSVGGTGIPEELIINDDMKHERNKVPIINTLSGNRVNFRLPATGEYELSILDIQGGLLTKVKGRGGAGTNSVQLNIKLRAGLCVVRLTSGGKTSLRYLPVLE